MRVGACPKCQSSNTEVVVKRRRKDEPYESFGICHHCGFESQKLRGDDADLLAQIATQEFNTVFSRGEGFPELDVLANEMSTLCSAICRAVPACEKCPLHNEWEGTPTVVSDEGYVSMTSKLGVRCSWQQLDIAKRDLLKQFPGLV